MSLPSLKLVYADGSNVLDADFQNGSLVKIVDNGSTVPFDNATYKVRITDGSFNPFYLREVSIPLGATESALFELMVSQQLPLNDYSQAVLDTGLSYYARILNFSQQDALGIIFSGKAVLPATIPQIAIIYEGIEYVNASGVLTEVQAGLGMTFVSTLPDDTGFAMAYVNPNYNGLTGAITSADATIVLGPMGASAGTAFQIDSSLGGQTQVLFGVNEVDTASGILNTWIQPVAVIAVSPPAEPVYSLAGQTQVAIESLNSQVGSLDQTVTSLAESLVNVEALAQQGVDGSTEALAVATTAEANAQQALLDASSALGVANTAEANAQQGIADASVALGVANTAEANAQQAISDASDALGVAQQAGLVGEQAQVTANGRASSSIALAFDGVVALPVVPSTPEAEAVDAWRNAELTTPGAGPASVLVVSADGPGEEIEVPFVDGAPSGAMYRLMVPLSSQHHVSIRFLSATGTAFLAECINGGSIGVVRIAGEYYSVDGF